MKARYWSLAIVLLLINYLVFASLFTRLLSVDFSSHYATRTPVPTFTPAPAQPVFVVIPTLTPVPVIPTATATRVIPTQAPDPQNASLEEAIQTDAGQPDGNAQLVAPGAVNIRSGPGLNYPVIGTLNADTAMPIIGRNPAGSWWKIKIAGDTTGWVANSVVNASNTTQVPAVEIPAPPAESSASIQAQPAAASAPPPEKPEHQFEPTGWWDDGNAGLTRFMGDILDANGNPVNGAFVQASCGDFSTISMPSGPVGWGPFNISDDWPAGFYDIVVDDKPVPCVWMLTVVDTQDRKNIKGYLSESIPVQITLDKSIVTANWRKNW